MVQPGPALEMLPVVLQPCDDNLVIEAGGPRGEDRQLQRENELPRMERDIRELFVRRKIASGHPADVAVKPFGWRGGKRQFLVLEADLKEVRAAVSTGYA